MILRPLLVVAWLAVSSGALAQQPASSDGMIPSDPLWLTGVRQPDLAPYSADFPEPATSKHFKVVNAGFWVAAREPLKLQVVAEFTLELTRPFDQFMYNRVTLENPADPASPVVYDGTLDPTSGSRASRAMHGPVHGIRAGETYTLMMEIFADAARTRLIEKIVQPVTASVSESDGCLTLDEQARAFLELPFRLACYSEAERQQALNEAADTPAAPAAARKPFWDASLPAQEGWHIGHKDIRDDAYVLEWVAGDDTVQDWSQRVTFSYEATPQAQFRPRVDAILATLQQDCPSFQHQFLDEQDTSLVVAFSDAGCDGYPARKVIARYMYEGGGLLGLQYAHYPEKIQPDMDAWRQRILAAKPVY